MNIEERVLNIEERNIKVQAEKAWETSYYRVFSIMVITYIVAYFALLVIGNENPFRNAFIPSLGYFISTQSLPFIKSWWISRYIKKY